MTQVMQSIKNTGLFLFGVVMIVVGHRVNDSYVRAQAEAGKAKASEAPEKTIAPQMPSKAATDMPAKAQAPEVTVKAKDTGKATPAKPKTKIEKAKPEKAHASKAMPQSESKPNIAN